LINDSRRQVENTQRQIVGTKNGFLCKKWPKYPFVWFYAEFGTKMQENMQRF